MAKIYTFLADGFETVEALAVVDVLRRAGAEVVTVSIKEQLDVFSAQKIWVKADSSFEDHDYSDGDCLFLPGGMPGTINLGEHEGLKNLILKYYEDKKYIAAICAAPRILGLMGLLKGCKATCFPGFEKDLTDAVYTGARVEEAGKIITGKGMGTAIDLGLKLIELLVDRETSEKIAKGTQYI